MVFAENGAAQFIGAQRARRPVTSQASVRFPPLAKRYVIEGLNL